MKRLTKSACPLLWLLTSVLILSSCSTAAPAEPPRADNQTKESATTAAPTTPELKPASFTVSRLTIEPKEATTGSLTTITVLVTNEGELAGSYDAILKINNNVEAKERVTLPGKASQNVTFGIQNHVPGRFSINIGGQSDTLIVSAPATSPVVQPSTPLPPPLPSMDAFMKGFNFADWNASNKQRPPNVGEMYGPLADGRLKELAALGTDWIILIVNVYQEKVSSTDVARLQYATPTDAALRRMIELAHSLGMRVMLNPNVEFSNDPTHNHTQIGSTYIGETEWKAWFASYREIAVYYANLSQNAGADMYIIGNELAGTVHRDADWRSIIQDVRQAYKGSIFYEATVSGNPGISEELKVKWWDALDYIGVLGYYPLTTSNNPTVEELKAAWIQKNYLFRLENLSKQYQKPIIMSEIGYLASDGTNTDPPNFPRFANAPLDLQEQADCYQAAFEVLWGKPWLKGIFWWQWLANPVWWPGGPTSKIEDINGKPAEQIVKRFYFAQ